MRIAVVHSYYSSKNPSGENTVVDEQVQTLRDAGHDVHLVARHTDREEQQTGYAARSAFVAATGRGPSPEDDLDRFRPDVVHVHNTFPNLGTRWLRGWADRSVVTLHNYRTVCAAATLFRDGAACHECLSTPVLPAVRHRCYRDSRAASVPVALATGPRGGLRQLLHLPAEILVLNELMAEVLSGRATRPVTVLPNFVATADQLATYDERRWAYVGRITEEKGLDRLLARWPEEHRLDVFGDGPLAGVLRQRYPSANVSWRGLVPREALLDELGRFAGLLIPSAWSEGIPTVALEAIARGVPLGLSAQVASGPAFTRSGAGRVLDLDGDVTQLGRDLDDLARDPGRRSSAQRLHQEQFSPEAWLARIEPVYARLAQGSARFS